MKISIVIPTYEVKGKGVSLLTDLLNSTKVQSYKNIEVVISDHSVDDEIKNYVESQKDKLNIVYCRTERGRGNSSINMNEGIKVATGDFIKIMHIDDKFCNEKAIEMMVLELQKDLNKDVKWGAFGFNHLYSGNDYPTREIIPFLFKNPRAGHVGLIGCPSVSFFINDKTNFFDENMIIFNDFDMHNRLLKKYGNPLIISDMCITIRMHQDQVTNILPEYAQKEQGEIDYFKQKNLN